jgi:hypothetical protein
VTPHPDPHDDPHAPFEGSWIRSRSVRIVVAVLVAIAMAAVMLGWAFLGLRRAEPDDRPADVVEVAAQARVA